MEEPKPKERYLHFKGKEYEVIAIARDCDNPERKIVVYKQLYESQNPFGTIWTRSLEDFLGNKEFKEETNILGRIFKPGEKVKKFQKIVR
jgi:hypothetical protein